MLTAAHQVVIQAAIGLLPPWARDMLGLAQPSLVSQAVVLPAAHLLLGGLRLRRRRAAGADRGPAPLRGRADPGLTRHRLRP